MSQPINEYETRGFWFVLKESTLFLKNSFGSIFSREFMVVLIPLLILWEVLPRYEVVPRSLVPAMSDVMIAFWELLVHKGFFMHILSSLGKFMAGLLLAIILAVPIGIIMGWNIAVRKHSLPLFQILAPIPPPAWVPLTIILFGVGLPMQVFLIFLGAFYPILFNTYQAIKDTDPRYLSSARVFGASEFTLICRVYFWHALGAIIMSIKTGVAIGLVMLVIAEMYGGRTGIGFVLVEAKDFFQIPEMVVCMLVLGMIGWFLIEILKFVELKLAIWKVGR
jgi:ABC-type nitrate/sulfonate/bicarbonate transport system permease component